MAAGETGTARVSDEIIEASRPNNTNEAIFDIDVFLIITI
jgi:hypothetical protein